MRPWRPKDCEVPYDFSVESADALRFLLQQRAPERRLLVKHFDSLAEDPYRRGDFRQIDREGRQIEIAVRGRFVIAYWSDHAVKPVRIVRIERVENRL